MLGLFTLSTCKKYPDGGFTKQGPKTFITDKAGAWQLALYEVNGIDSTTLLIGASNINNYYGFFLTSSQYNCGGKDKCLKAGIPLFSYEVNFINNNKEIRFISELGQTYCFSYMTSTVCLRNVICPEQLSTTWEIIKLRDKECVLTTQLNNSYKIILKR